METQGIRIRTLPELRNPILIAGFSGWGNAMEISTGMADYLISALHGELFADLVPDDFYRYDAARPQVTIENGILKRFSPPEGQFYAAQTDTEDHDLVILRAEEPNYRWHAFADALFTLCARIGVEFVITLGGMYDNVLHTDSILSGIASHNDLMLLLKAEGVIPINYSGPSAIHSMLHAEGIKRGFRCLSLWSHCPYYIQGTTHFGLLSHLTRVLSRLGKFSVDTRPLEKQWKEINDQIQKLMENSPEIQSIVTELRKAKVRGSWENVRISNKKVINISDFLEPN